MNRRADMPQTDVDLDDDEGLGFVPSV